jgi:hypothetical protein
LKKEAKTFAHLAYALGQRERLIIKSFLVLFFKKELLPFVSQPYPWWRSGMGQTQANLVLDTSATTSFTKKQRSPRPPAQLSQS